MGEKGEGSGGKGEGSRGKGGELGGKGEGTGNGVPPCPPPQYYIPSLKVTGLLVLEKKIFKRFLPYMGMAAIFVM